MRQQTGTRKRQTPPAAPSDTAIAMVIARDILGDLVDQARRAGKRTVLSKNGKPAAAIVSIADYNKLTAA